LRAYIYTYIPLSTVSPGWFWLQGMTLSPFLVLVSGMHALPCPATHALSLWGSQTQTGTGWWRDQGGEMEPLRMTGGEGGTQGPPFMWGTPTWTPTWLLSFHYFFFKDDMSTSSPARFNLHLVSQHLWSTSCPSVLSLPKRNPPTLWGTSLPRCPSIHIDMWSLYSVSLCG
jgi:hypothetical protein